MIVTISLIGDDTQLIEDVQPVSAHEGHRLDDCLLKPVLITELIARVRALLHRGPFQLSWQRSFFVDGDLVVDLTRREVQLPALSLKGRG